MRRLLFPLSMLLLAACASVERPQPLTSDEVIVLSKSGASAQQVIDELKRTDTVLPLMASDIVRLHDAGVANEVLDYLQRAQIDEIRWRDRYSSLYWYNYGPLYRGFSTCPWPTLRPFPPGMRPGIWGC